jgi:NTP pyrophosphatase (non-canonical NTP hydrolase)
LEWPIVPRSFRRWTNRRANAQFRLIASSLATTRSKLPVLNINIDHPQHLAIGSQAVELSEYQHLSRRTAGYPRGARLTYPALGLAGEAGEVAEHAKKIIRDDGGIVSDARRAAMAAELGDVLWYVAQLATELDLRLDEIAQGNLEKLLSRQRRGVLSGDGDDR